MNSTLEVGVDGRLVCAAEEAQLAGITLGRSPSTSIQEDVAQWVTCGVCWGKFNLNAARVLFATECGTGCPFCGGNHYTDAGRFTDVDMLRIEDAHRMEYRPIYIGNVGNRLVIGVNGRDIDRIVPDPI